MRYNVGWEITMKIDLDRYSEFVFEVTSAESKDLTTLMDRMDRLDANYEAYGSAGEMQHGPDVNVPLLITGALGLGAESGEFQEVVKKMLFQGKPLSGDTLFHMKRELGDILWYWVNACRSLNLDPNDVIAENVNKLKARYPGGTFDPYYSENRKEGDV
jgi:NTP pyrophosphatase (non-canonical NTP hydrolase)